MKVNRIRELSVLKEAEKAERRDNALRHQEMLAKFINDEKANRIDERPINYAEDANTSAFKSHNRSASRSPTPLSRSRFN